jgi:hypothetical protein
LWLDEWKNFLSRIGRDENSQDSELFDSPNDILELRFWASYRGQTLARTGELFCPFLYLVSPSIIQFTTVNFCAAHQFYFLVNYCALALFEYNKGGFALERLTLLVSLCEVCFCLFGG